MATMHQGSCHCGAVRYEVETDLSPVFDCNCSYCTKSGALWTYAGKDQFKLLSGEDQLLDYQFNKKVIHHLFCRNCGISSFGTGKGEDGTEGVGVNARCLDDIDIAALKLTPFDGKSL